MAEGTAYSREKDLKNRMLLNDLKKQLPVSTYEFLDEKSDNNPNTAVAYARDLLTFFTYLTELNPMFKNKATNSFTEEELEALTFHDINEYQRYLSVTHPEINGETFHEEGRSTIARRMAALRGYYGYECEHHFMEKNPTQGASKTSTRKEYHEVTRLTQEEVQAILEVVKSGNIGSDRQRKHLENTKYRDLAILTLFLNTGIRVSECVGLDITDIDFRENSLHIFRKGRKTSTIYFHDIVAEALKDYIELERPKYADGDTEKALFLSTQKKRMAVRSVQAMIKKYATVAVSNKKISPHKMRSTYGTALYNNTGDIRLVADVLGHTDINTTAKHYIDIEDEHRRQAAKINLYDN